MKEIAKSLDLKDPAIVQGMYIFKQPGIGDPDGWTYDDDDDDNDDDDDDERKEDDQPLWSF